MSDEAKAEPAWKTDPLFADMPGLTFVVPIVCIAEAAGFRRLTGGDRMTLRCPP